MTVRRLFAHPSQAPHPAAREGPSAGGEWDGGMEGDELSLLAFPLLLSSSLPRFLSPIHAPHPTSITSLSLTAQESRGEIGKIILPIRSALARAARPSRAPADNVALYSSTHFPQTTHSFFRGPLEHQHSAKIDSLNLNASTISILSREPDLHASACGAKPDSGR